MGEFLRATVAASTNDDSSVLEVDGPGHGAEALLEDRGDDLIDRIVIWIGRLG